MIGTYLPTYFFSSKIFKKKYNIVPTANIFFSGEAYDDPFRQRAGGTIFSTILGTPKQQKSTLIISEPKEFRQVSAIIDVDLVPETCRRNVLVYNWILIEERT